MEEVNIGEKRRQGATNFDGSSGSFGWGLSLDEPLLIRTPHESLTRYTAKTQAFKYCFSTASTIPIS